MPSNGSEQRDIARPTFYAEAVKNNSESEKEGRPIFENKEFIKIEIPGDKHLTWIGEVEAKHRERWLQQYEAFKRGEQRATTGTPLDQWPNPELTKARVAEIKAHNILSVEELAGIPDGTLPKLGMGARELREQARTYIAAAKEGAGEARLAAEVARLKEMVERLSGVPAKEPEPQKTKALEDCSDDELKEFIKRETGEGVRGKPNRATLLNRAGELANKQEAA